MAEKTVKTSKHRKGNLMLLIISACLAFILWLFLSLTAFPEVTVPLKDVEIDYDYSGSYADIAGLSIMNKYTESVNLRISGLRYLIGEYTNSDIKVKINVDTVRSPGVYELNLVVTSANGDTIVVDQIEPSTVKVEFDYMVKKIYSIEDGTLTADISNLSAANGYLIDPSEIVINPSFVELYGPRDYVNQITSCVLTVNSRAPLTSDVNTNNVDLIYYSGTNVFESEKVTPSVSKFSLNVPVYRKKELPFSINFLSYTSSFDYSSLEGKYRIEPESITVKSKDERILGLESIHLATVDLKRITVGTILDNYTIENTAYYTNISGVETARIIFELDGYSEKTVNINNSQIFVINNTTGHNITVETDRINNIKIVGPSEIIERIDSSDVIAQLDLMNYGSQTTGAKMYYVTIYLPEYPECWALGTHQIYCNVEEDADNAVIEE